MKKLFYSVFTAVTMLLAVTSCSQEEDFAQSSQQTTSFNISLNGAVGSRAIGDGTRANELHYQVFLDGESVKKETVSFRSGLNLDLPLLNGETYSIVFWAQNSGCSIYDLDNLSNIKVNYANVSANQESYDAFYNALVNFKADGNTHRVELRRPFAQLNLGTGDWSDVIVPGGTDPVTATSVTVKGLADTFAPLTGEASGSVNATFDYSELPAGTFKVNDADYQYLSLNYLLVPGEKAPQGTQAYVAQTNEDKATVNLTFNLKRGDKVLQPISVPNAPLQRNWRTNIIGDVLTGTNFDIVVKPETDGENNSMDIFKEVLTNGGEFIMLSDLTLNEDITIPAGVTAKIKLDEHALNLDNFGIKVEGNLIIEDGTINVNGTNSIGLLLWNDDDVTSLDINDAVINVIGGAAAIVPYQSGSSVINFRNSVLNVENGLGGVYGVYWADDLKVNLYNSTIKGKNGLYVNAKNAEVLIDEKSSASEFNMTGGNLLVAYDGVKPTVKDVNTSSPSVITYKNISGTEYEGIYQVENKKEYDITSVEGIFNLHELMAEITTGEGQGVTLNLKADVDLANQPFTPIDKMWVTFNGNGHTIKNLNVSATRFAGFFGYAGAVTINDLTIENANVTGSQAGIFAARGEGFKANNCYLKGTNTVTYSPTVEDYNGIGAVTGLLSDACNVNVEIVNGTTVTLNKSGMATVAAYVDVYTGYLKSNNGTVTDNGTVTSVVIVNNDTELSDAINNAPVNAATTITLAAGTYSSDIKLTLAERAQVGDLVFKAAEGADVVIAGTVTLGYRVQGTGAAMWNANVTFEGITFDHAEAEKHSLDVQDVKSLNLKNCKIIGDGEYGIGSASGNGTGASKIEYCTFENAGMQVLGNFGKDLIIDNCTFEESRINVQGGSGVTVQNCVFSNTLTTSNVGDSFYLIRSNSIPITVKYCTLNIDSELTDVAVLQTKWGILWNRGTTNWTVNNVDVTMTDAAMQQTELLVTKCTSTGAINCSDLTVNGSTYITEGLLMNQGEFEIYKAAGLSYFSGKSLDATINLIADIDMKNQVIKTIAASRSKTLTVKGNNNSIKNVKLADGGHNTVGNVSLFQAYPGSTLNIKDLAIDGVTIENATYAAAIVGYNEGVLTLDNVDVTKATINSTKTAGVLVGYTTGNVTIKDSDVKESTVTTTGTSSSGTPYPAAAYVARVNNCTATITSSTNTTSLSNIGEVLGTGTATIDGNAYSE